MIYSLVYTLVQFSSQFTLNIKLMVFSVLDKMILYSFYNSLSIYITVI